MCAMSGMSSSCVQRFGPDVMICSTRLLVLVAKSILEATTGKAQNDECSQTAMTCKHGEFTVYSTDTNISLSVFASMWFLFTILPQMVSPFNICSMNRSYASCIAGVCECGVMTCMPCMPVSIHAPCQAPTPLWGCMHDKGVMGCHVKTAVHTSPAVLGAGARFATLVCGSARCCLATLVVVVVLQCGWCQASIDRGEVMVR